MKPIQIIVAGVMSACVAPACFAHIFYNPEHSETMKNLTAVESSNVNLQYQCGQFSLFISAFATESELNRKNASVTGKITSDDSSHDISNLLTRAISRHDVLTGQIAVECNAEKGAFKLEIIPSQFAKEEAGTLTVVKIFSDGTVVGSRMR